MTEPLRCAIYTRKSSEEGLEQGFNSLHAQREACEAYILSQAGEGWSALSADYDDGGFSGGSLERPGVQALLTDIRHGLVDVVVVYKVDRLTRALGDFARMVELFDEHKVSFVSVTQAFNTTTSMGRLTLNVLLSFAQFEREVTGERIRDKIAASKAKGMWMGGRPPLGYDGEDRKLVVNREEADRVRHIFERYVELGSVLKLAADLKARGVTAKHWVNQQGAWAGGGTLGRGALYHLLANPVYRGAIRHKDRLYPNAHPPIIDEQTWTSVQAKLAENATSRPGGMRCGTTVLLRGLLFDDRGSPMSVVHTTRGNARYRYYAVDTRDAGRSAGSLPRIAMGVMDAFVIACVKPLLSLGWLPDEPLPDRVSQALSKVTAGEDRIAMILRPEALISDVANREPDANRVENGVELAVSVRLKHRKGALIIDAPRRDAAPIHLDRTLIRAVCLTRAWADQLATGEVRSIRDLAIRQGLCNHYASRMMPLAWLAPDLVTAILEGRQPTALTLGALTQRPLPMGWAEQRDLFASL